MMNLGSPAEANRLFCFHFDKRPVDTLVFLGSPLVGGQPKLHLG